MKASNVLAVLADWPDWVFQVMLCLCCCVVCLWVKLFLGQFGLSLAAPSNKRRGLSRRRR